ncbi:MAG: ribosome silencing factor [Muribaculaceae bacterium]|nr:ribosome silencing factor [Muribaculaceae bacterium]
MIEQQELIKNIVEGLQERKGHDITIVDLSENEYATTSAFVICSGTSKMQVDSIADSVRDYVREHGGVKPFNYDGYDNSEWIVIDYGTVYVHVFEQSQRERYNLEELWSDCKITKIEDIY